MDSTSLFHTTLWLILLTQRLKHSNPTKFIWLRLNEMNGKGQRSERVFIFVFREWILLLLLFLHTMDSRELIVFDFFYILILFRHDRLHQRASSNGSTRVLKLQNETHERWKEKKTITWSHFTHKFYKSCSFCLACSTKKKLKLRNGRSHWVCTTTTIMTTDDEEEGRSPGPNKTRQTKTLNLNEYWMTTLDFVFWDRRISIFLFFLGLIGRIE